MSGSEEETYSTMFTSLRHPARRKILRMLSDKPRSFSEMLEELGISSSHLTYHLENLGELISKMDDGRYRLSNFGEAAVATMSRVEEAPKTTEPRYRLSLPIRWKFSFVALMVVTITLASVWYIQYQSLNQLSTEYEQLKAKYEKMTAWTPPEPWEPTTEMIGKLEDVEQQAIPRLERLVKDEGLPVSNIGLSIDNTRQELLLRVEMWEIRPEYQAEVLDILGWNVPIRFVKVEKWVWPNPNINQLDPVIEIVEKSEQALIFRPALINHGEDLAVICYGGHRLFDVRVYRDGVPVFDSTTQPEYDVLVTARIKPGEAHSDPEVEPVGWLNGPGRYRIVAWAYFAPVQPLKGTAQVEYTELSVERWIEIPD